MSARDPFLATDADYRLQELAAYADAQRDADLLDQVADSTEERDNVRRILGAETRQPGMRNLNAPRIESGQLSERELDTANAERWASVLADRRALVRLLDEAGSAPGYSACSGPCAQGRKPCPTSDACECPERAPLRAGDLLRARGDGRAGRGDRRHPHHNRSSRMTYLRDLWHDIKLVVGQFIYIRRHLRRGGCPDDAPF